MLNIHSSLIEELSASDSSLRRAAAAEIYRRGCALAERAVAGWWQEGDLSALLLAPDARITIGIAVQRETFARIRHANGDVELAVVPPDQDAEEFELRFSGGVQLDVLTSRDPNGQGAIARYLAKLGEGIQQVEYYCLDVERAMSILRERFQISAIYPKARPGADGTKINFFLLPTHDDEGAPGKILIELYQTFERTQGSP